MNGSDGVDLVAELFPKRVARALALAFVVLFAFHSQQASRLLFWYAEDKARGIVDIVMEQAPTPTATSPSPEESRDTTPPGFNH